MRLFMLQFPRRILQSKTSYLTHVAFTLTLHRPSPLVGPRTHQAGRIGWRQAVCSVWAGGHLQSPPPTCQSARSWRERRQHTSLCQRTGLVAPGVQRVFCGLVRKCKLRRPAPSSHLQREEFSYQYTANGFCAIWKKVCFDLPCVGFFKINLNFLAFWCHKLVPLQVDLPSSPLH